MASSGINISLKSYDSIFQSEEQRNTEEIKPVPISELKPFTEQPFKVCPPSKNGHKKASKNGMNRNNSFVFIEVVAFIPRFT